jgi:hypothetical protein
VDRGSGFRIGAAHLGAGDFGSGHPVERHASYIVLALLLPVCDATIVVRVGLDFRFAPKAAPYLTDAMGQQPTSQVA